MTRHALAVLLSVAALSSAHAEPGWRLFPVGEPGFKMEPTLALTANTIEPKDSSADSATAVGLDFNFNCGLIQDPQNRMRTHLIVTKADEDHVERLGVELSPRYTVPLGGGLAVGVGPSLGSFSVKSGSFDESYFGVGLAAGVDYRAGAFYLGADLRYHATGEKKGVDNDHTVAGVKVGVNF